MTSAYSKKVEKLQLLAGFETAAGWKARTICVPATKSAALNVLKIQENENTFRQSERTGGWKSLTKLQRAHDGCLGANRRRRT